MDIETLKNGLLHGKAEHLARAITLVESRRADHRQLAQQLLSDLAGHTGKSTRIGITGAPGVGKSTLIETLGVWLIGEGHRLAVLAVDPSSVRTGGSILGDKTRMQRLAAHNSAFVRPSPSSGSLGGVAAKTREAMLLCEAAGFDIIIIETMGVGQSETAVADMVDFFLVLQLPRAGDDLQGIKKGVLELADMIAVNKADGEGKKYAERTAADYRTALNILSPQNPLWTPPVLAISALENEGLDKLWQQILAYQKLMGDVGKWREKREEQRIHWMWAMFDDELKSIIQERLHLRSLANEIEKDVRSGHLQPASAVKRLLSALGVVKTG